MVDEKIASIHRFWVNGTQFGGEVKYCLGQFLTHFSYIVTLVTGIHRKDGMLVLMQEFWWNRFLRDLPNIVFGPSLWGFTQGCGSKLRPKTFDPNYVPNSWPKNYSPNSQILILLFWLLHHVSFCRHWAKPSQDTCLDFILKILPAIQIEKVAGCPVVFRAKEKSCNFKPWNIWLKKRGRTEERQLDLWKLMAENCM